MKDDLLRISAIYKQNIDIGIKDKQMELRVYGAYTINNIDGAGRQYQNTIGSTDKAGLYDYRFDEYLLNRNAQVGMLQNQISNRRDFSKFVGLITDNETWMLNTSLTVPLPGKIPIKPYVEFLIYDGIADQNWNTSGAGMVYNVGLEIELIPNRFEIFLNLAQSNDVTTYQEKSTIDGFLERITFVLDLNGLTPPKIKKAIKLF